MQKNQNKTKHKTNKQKPHIKQAQLIRANTQNNSGHLEEKVMTVVAQVLLIK